MLFQETKLSGVFEIQIEPNTDERGFFARTWCQKEFGDQGLNTNLVQCSISLNRRRGTLRGVHYQAAPFAETKVVRCTAGAIYDVVLDLREAIANFQAVVRHSVERREPVVRSIFREGCAHGFLTLTEESEVLYQMSEFYHPEAARGVRWNDPAFQIAWPEKVRSNL